MHLLVVEDEPKLAEFIGKALAKEQCFVDLAGSGLEALERLGTTTYDLIILDVMIPKPDGIELCRTIRKAGSTIPILMLSARRTVEDRVLGLDSGADDYLTKPFTMTELSARVRALLRRLQKAPAFPLRVADLTLDPSLRIVKRGPRAVDLTTREFDLLEYLMRHAGHAVTRQMIAEHVWGITWDRLTNVIDVFVNHLRKKLEEPSEARLIHAVRGVGYVIRQPRDTDS